MLRKGGPVRKAMITLTKCIIHKCFRIKMVVTLAKYTGDLCIYQFCSKRSHFSSNSPPWLRGNNKYVSPRMHIGIDRYLPQNSLEHCKYHVRPDPFTQGTSVRKVLSWCSTSSYDMQGMKVNKNWKVHYYLNCLPNVKPDDQYKWPRFSLGYQMTKYCTLSKYSTWKNVD